MMTCMYARMNVCLCMCMFPHVAFDNVVDMEMEEDLDILMTTPGVCMYTINLNGVKLSDPTLHLHEVTEKNGMVCVYIHKWSPHHTGKTYVCMGQYVFPHPALLMYGDSMCSHTQHYLCMGTVCVPTPSITYFMYAC